MEIKDFVDKLKGFSYVSFDIFDTLMFRAVLAPYDQLKLVEIRAEERYGLNCSDFVNARYSTECVVRGLAHGREVTLQDIYDNIDLYDDTTKSTLYKIECEVEQMLCLPNKPMIDVLSWCIENGKHVIITTDMYLPRDTIEKILCKIGVKYERLFISSEEGVTKRTGDLFKVVLSNLGICPGDIIHIGDDLNNDIEQPRSYGIKSLLRLMDDNAPITYFSKKKNIKTSCIRILTKWSLQRMEEVSSAERVGYSVMGPFMVDFCQWIHRQKEEQNIEVLAFVSREGFLIWKSYCILYPQEKDETCYVALNKNILRLPSLQGKGSIQKFLKSMPERKSFLWHDICKYLQIEDIDSVLNELCLNYPNVDILTGIERECIINGLFDSEISFLLNIQRKTIRRQQELFDKYLIKIGFFKKKVGLVNNSIQGSGQSLLEQYIMQSGRKCNIFGLQFTATKLCNDRLHNRYSAFFKQGLFPKKYQYYAINYCFLLEHLMFESVGSAFSLDEQNGNIVVVSEKQRKERNNNEYINKVIKSAQKFCVDFKKTFNFNMDGIGADLFFTLCLRPFKLDAASIGALWDDDVENDRQLIDSSVKYSKRYILKGKVPNKILWSNGFLVLNNCNQCEITWFMISSKIRGHIDGLIRRLKIKKYL